MSKFLNYKINIEAIISIFSFIFLIWLIFFFLINENYNFSFNLKLSLSSVFILFSLVNFINLKIKNQLITLLNINFVIFYLSKLFFLIINDTLLYSYLNDYKNLNVYIFELSIQYFFISLAVFVIFYKFYFHEIIDKKLSFDKEKLLLYLKISFCVCFFLIFQNIMFELLEKYFYFQGFLESSFYHIFRKLTDIDHWVYICCVIFFLISKDPRGKLLFLIILLIYVVNGMILIGSRSTPLQIVLNFIFIFTIFNQIYKVKVKYLLFLGIFSSIVPIYFSIAGAARKYFFIEKSALNCQGMVHCFKDNDLSNFMEYWVAQMPKDGSNIKIFKTYMNYLTGVLDRISYLDFYFINMSHKDLITKNINLFYYFKSTVDKFSPGFDFYGVPLIKNLLYSIIYGPSPFISNSLQFTLFAENLIIFEYYYIIVVALSLLIFRFFLNLIKKFNSNSIKILFIIFLVQVYWLFLNGYGYDYLLVKSVYLTIFIIPLSYLIRIHEK
tara:strand:- start:2946 stop:4436 length:1491 start_codon:yes stop_codon:yes gene_type:complete